MLPRHARQRMVGERSPELADPIKVVPLMQRTRLLALSTTVATGLLLRRRLDGPAESCSKSTAVRLRVRRAEPSSQNLCNFARSRRRYLDCHGCERSKSLIAQYPFGDLIGHLMRRGGMFRELTLTVGNIALCVGYEFASAGVGRLPVGQRRFPLLEQLWFRPMFPYVR